MQNAKATAWGAGLMGMAGLAGAVLGPSPLLLPLAPFVGIAYVSPFMLVTAALGNPDGARRARARGQGGVRRVVRSARGGAQASCSELGEHEGASDDRARFTLGNRHHRHGPTAMLIRYGPETSDNVLKVRRVRE